jgi:hypothetical protein
MTTPKNNLLWPEDHNDSQAVTQAKWDDYIRRTSSPSALAALGLQAPTADTETPAEEESPAACEPPPAANIVQEPRQLRRGVVS